jgi:UDP-N-acetylmuramoylalanine--D-glutamate ligase
MKNPVHALVLGLGRSGKAAARLLASEGASVTSIDEAEIDWIHPGVTVLGPMHSLPDGPFDLAVVSPGIPPGGPWLTELLARGVHCVSELEFGWSRCRAHTLAITGSLGKSTVAAFCHHCLEKAGRKSVLAGNIGTPVSEIALEAPEQDVLVLEVSSFQCEQMHDFHPEVAVLLNLVPNHLDRHGDMQAYEGAKAQMFMQMGEGDVALVHEAHAEAFQVRCNSPGSEADPEWQVFGISNDSGWTYDRSSIFHQGEPVLSLSGSLFAHPVFGVNAAAAVAALTALGLSPGQVQEGLRDFTGLPHRMQDLGTKSGVRFIDDSKSTTLSSLVAAVSMLDGPVHLIAGGIVKEIDVSFVKAFLANRPLTVYLIGRDAERLYQGWSGEMSCKVVNTLQDALEAIWRIAVRGETILLSPGCASFDQFENYEHRGRCFAGYVESLS